MVEAVVVRLSCRRRIFAPLALAVSAVAMLFDGLRLLLSNWRLILVQVLPAMWIWAAMLDLKLHVLHGETFRVIRGPVLIPVLAGVVAITMASFFLNAVFAFAIARPGPPQIRPAFTTAVPARAPPPTVQRSCPGVSCGLFLSLTGIYAMTVRGTHERLAGPGPLPADRSA
jgi:hypothetical protein